MIVSVTEKNRNNYIDLFTKAMTALKGKNIIPETDTRDRLSSLGEYYHYMADLADIDGYFAMIPLDEQVFEIDANTRTINIPAGFAKCTTVQSDKCAEMLVFTIDRYFDYTDLGADTEIYAVWSAPTEKGAPAETRATKCFKDATGTTDKLRFAWILDEVVTKTAGSVKFSIRICRKDPTTEAVVYSFNTLTSSITICPVLDPALTQKPNIDDPIADNVFKNAIVNSMYAPDGVLPKAPSFAAPGQNFEEDAIRDLNADNTLMLTAQALTPDTGTIDYYWQYSKDGKNWVDYDETQDPFKNVEIVNLFVPIIAENSTEDGTAPVSYVHRELRENYYCQKDTKPTEYGDPIEEGTAGIEFIPYNTISLANAVEEVGVLYEKVSAYKINDSEDEIVGYYRVGATNTLTSDSMKEGSKTNTTGRVYSRPCHLPAPQAIEYVTNLVENAIITEKEITNEDGTTETVNVATLAIELVEDPNKPVMTYEWKHSEEKIDEDADWLLVAGENGEISKDVTTPGWYRVYPKATKNRTETESAPSNVCRVTNPVAPLTVTRVATAMWPVAEQNHITIEVADRDKEIELKVAITNPLPNLLISDEQAYVWEIQEDNEAEWHAVDENTPNYQSGLDTDTLIVKYSDGWQNYRCTVINTLNGQTASSNSIQFVLFGATE